MANGEIPTTPKPGYQTTEFYLSMAAAVISALFASGVIGTGSRLEMILGIIGSILSTLGYTVSRAIVKK